MRSGFTGAAGNRHDPTEGNAMEQGLVHLYYGEGKGKTTAAMGLALRALGHGQRVCIVQFAKDGASGEVEPLRRLGATVCAGKEDPRFASQLSDEERDELRMRQDALLRQLATEAWDLVILDEACFAVRAGLVDEDLLMGMVRNRLAGTELVLTGRDPALWMLELADYATEMRCVRHPYEHGICAREGVEW